MVLLAEKKRLNEVQEKSIQWYKWGPYLSERQWGTVREDYSDDGSAWDYFTHDQARSRAYRWGEDGIAGISDDKQRICFAVTLWNGQDPILKERLFGLTNSEGNHGEDVKEYYFYLDNTPTHSYMKYLYKYPQKAYPYSDLVNKNKSRSRIESEYELIDTGIFNNDHYFDVFVEYAKKSPEDIIVKITVYNRGKNAATLHVLPTIWFRNIWFADKDATKPKLCLKKSRSNVSIVKADHPELGSYYLYCEGNVRKLFTENETNNQRLFGSPNSSRYVKDGINNYIVNHDAAAVNPDKIGTKACADYNFVIGGGEKKTIRLRLSNISPETMRKHLGEKPSLFDSRFDTIINLRRKEADDFYDSIYPSSLNEDERLVMRQAFAGMLWTKQFYYYDLAKWLKEHDIDLYSRTGKKHRNAQWYHMVNSEIISMPDKWEYPWYAAWDLAFHAIALSLIDPYFAKQQLELMLTERYIHPSGQIPAYEWSFSDVNPPVHAWAVIFNYRIEQLLTGKGDIKFLETAFQKLLMNFTWWVNRKDRQNTNIFEGGFLGLDNIGVFDRNTPLPDGISLEQADSTAWMALFCQNMLEIAIELARHNPIYEDWAIKFFEHFLWIVKALNSSGLWDEIDGFFFDMLRAPDGRTAKIKVRSMVGLISFCANTVYSHATLKELPALASRTSWFMENHPEMLTGIHDPRKQGAGGSHLLSLTDDVRLRRILSRMLDENEFLSPFGIRSLSRSYANTPYTIKLYGHDFSIRYDPAESTTGDFGGNSNWRGPIWFPVNMLIIRGLLNLYEYYGDDFLVEFPTGSGKQMNLFEVSKEIASRLSKIFLRNKEGHRPVHGGTTKFQTDQYWKDNVLFYEYFHGDNGAGIGASHQTGWTGLIAVLLEYYGVVGVNEARAHAYKGIRPRE